VASLLKKIESVPVGSLEFYPGNPRRGNVAVIASSLAENEQYAPIVVQRSTRCVLAGNHTLKAAVSLGWPEIDVVFVDVDDARARKIVLSSNRTGELPDPDTGQRYDDHALAELLASLDGDLDGTGWDVYDIDGLADKLDDDKGGDAPTDDLPATFGVIVECDTEQQQARLLAELDGEGFRVRALMS
jgi:ParB-like chromosome segregation protein Spo0J